MVLPVRSIFRAVFTLVPVLSNVIFLSVSVSTSLAVIVNRPSVAAAPATVRSSTVTSTLVATVTFSAEPVILEISLPEPVSVTVVAGKSTTSALMTPPVCVMAAPSRLSLPPVAIVTSSAKVMFLAVVPSLAVISASPGVVPTVPVSSLPTVRSFLVTSLSEPASPLIAWISLAAEDRSTALVLVVSLSATLPETTAPPDWVTAPSKVMPLEVSLASSVPALWVKPSPTVVVLRV